MTGIMPRMCGMKFRNSVVWITGASSGIGEACAYEFSRQGAKLILSARREDRLAAIRAKCRDPREVFVLPMDMTEIDLIPHRSRQAAEVFGPIDLVVHNAGISQRSLATESDLSVDRRIMEVNYFSIVALTKELLPNMIERKQGQVAVVSSVTGFVGTPLRSAYAASKHALHGFFDSLRAEVHDHGISVTLICPGFIQTEISKSALVGDGSEYQVMDQAQQNGMPVAKCARKIVKAIYLRKREVFIGGKEIAGIYLKKWFPGVAATVVRKIKST